MMKISFNHKQSFTVTISVRMTPYNGTSDPLKKAAIHPIKAKIHSDLFIRNMAHIAFCFPSCNK
jgi:hypothetical protein